MEPLVSVLIPVYNTKYRYLREAIESILNQTYGNFELLIINDASCDNAEDVILSYKDERIKYYKNETNLKLIATLNKGIELSKGKYIARLDADDYCTPDRLEKQVKYMEEHPDTEVIFLGVGFETTAPGTAACILEAASRKLNNFSVLCLLKRTEPALRSLIESDDFAVNGFLCPGHVAAIIGADGFSFLPDDYRLPGVVSGFEPGDLLCSILELTEMLAHGTPELKNEYTRLVRQNGNPAALALMEQIFCPAPSDWRGLGLIEDSGYAIRSQYAQWDAMKKFSLSPAGEKEIPGCRCAQVIRGVLRPAECPLFKKVLSV